MNGCGRLALLVAVVVFAMVQGLRPVPAGATIMFDVPDQGLPYSEGGFDFVAGGGGSVLDDWSIDSGTLLIEASDGQVFATMTRSGGGTFDLISLDYSYSGVDNNGWDDWFIQSNLGDLVVLDSLAASGTLVLDWIGVTSVDFRIFEPNANSPGHTLRIDNIVPEPSSAVLLTMGLFGLVYRKRRPLG